MNNFEEKIINLMKELTKKDIEHVIVFVEYLIYKREKELKQND